MSKNSYFQEHIDPHQKGSLVIRSEHYMRYVFARDYLSKKGSRNTIVYDIGCGNGYGIQILVDSERMLSDTVFGFDRSAELIAERKNRSLRLFQVDFDTQNVTQFVKKQSLPKPEVIICFETLEHLESPEKILQQCSALLTKHCLLIVSVPNEQYEPKKNGKPKNSYHKHLFSLASLSLLLQENGFRVKEVYGQPYANQFYHKARKYMKLIDMLTNNYFNLFKQLAKLIGKVEKNKQQKSYSIVVMAEKS